MGEVALAAPKKLTIFPWGRGIYDLRYFEGDIRTEEEVEKLRQTYAGSSYSALYLNFPVAIESLKLTLADAPPGIYFAGNPHYGQYGKWNLALVAAGFKRVPGCAINRVYERSWTWKNKPRYNFGAVGTCDCATCKGARPVPGQTLPPWESADGFQHWIHAFYYIKEGLTEPIKFDFSNRNLKATSGDDHASLWQINYGGRNQAPVGSGWARGEAKNFLTKFARLSKNCGIAMGEGLPECGKYLDEEFFTIAALPDGQKFPAPWNVFLEYGGQRFAHNLRKLDTAQLPCPHSMELP